MNPTPTQIAYHALETSLARFMPRSQRLALQEQLKGEEALGIAEIVNNIADTVSKMPSTGLTEGQGDEAIVYLHYFRGSVNAYVIEKDAGDPDNGDISQWQAFGMINLYGDADSAEKGYINIEELIEHHVELDLYWKPVSIAQLLKPEVSADPTSPPNRPRPRFA